MFATVFLRDNHLHYKIQCDQRAEQRPYLPAAALLGCQGRVHGLHAVTLPHKGWNQELVNRTRAASLPLGLYDASSNFTGTVAKSVTGPSLGQSDAITAALQASQASMTTVLSQPDHAQAAFL